MSALGARWWIWTLIVVLGPIAFLVIAVRWSVADSQALSAYTAFVLALFAVIHGRYQDAMHMLQQARIDKLSLRTLMRDALLELARVWDLRSGGEVNLPLKKLDALVFSDCFGRAYSGDDEVRQVLVKLREMLTGLISTQSVYDELQEYKVKDRGSLIRAIVKVAFERMRKELTNMGEEKLLILTPIRDEQKRTAIETEEGKAREYLGL